MHILDTDHMSVLERGGSAALNLQMHLAALSEDDVVTTIVTYEEQVRGRLATLGRTRNATELVAAYGYLKDNLAIYSGMNVLPFDAPAAQILEQLQQARVRIGTQDLKIAAITLAHGATLLSRNLGDFGKVPGLSVEDWTA